MRTMAFVRYWVIQLYMIIKLVDASFKCPDDCSQVMCVSLSTLKEFCKGGIVYGICGCCQVCAKIEGESCGGLSDSYGKCDTGLLCYPGSRPKHRQGICRCKN